MSQPTAPTWETWQTKDQFEFAAKAAGYTKTAWVEDANGVERFQVYSDNTMWLEWNPRDDDGDAFRLAKKLFLSFDVGFGGCQIVVRRKSYGIGPAVEVVVNGDLPGATLSDAAYRSAFLLAAAEIGKAMR